MRAASARIRRGDQQIIGTAWRFHDRYALTAAHCFGGPDASPPSSVHLHFEGADPVDARVVDRAPQLDAALLEITSPVPASVEMIALSHPPPEDPLSPIPWRAIGYPRANGGDETILGGEVRGYVSALGAPRLQLALDDFSNRALGPRASQLEGASGAAIVHERSAIALLVSGLPDTQVAHATPIAEIAKRFPVVRERLGDYPLAIPSETWRECDRKPQWNAVLAAIADAGSRVLVVGGHAREDHDVFADRVHSWCRSAPMPVRAERVSWRGGPLAKADLLDALSPTLGRRTADERELGARLDARARGRTVWIHPVLDVADREADLDDVVAYYAAVTRMIASPTLAASAGGHVFLQPVAWTGAASRRLANGLVGRLVKLAPTRVARLADLPPLAAGDLVESGAPASLITRWKRDPTTRHAHRLLKQFPPAGR